MMQYMRVRHSLLYYKLLVIAIYKLIVSQDIVPATQVILPDAIYVWQSYVVAYKT